MSLELNAYVICSKAENVSGTFDVITARAVAPLGKLLDLSLHLSTRNSIWVLPKGRFGESELAAAKQTWQGSFHVEPSTTDAQSTIVIATGVERR
jgi:16S rRNA (guanine527-N7)-methyltransferase